MSWQREELEYQEERRKRLQQPFDREAVIRRVEAMISRSLHSKPEDWDGWPLHVSSVTLRHVEGASRLYINGEVDLLEAASTDPRAWDEAARTAAQLIEKGYPVPIFLRAFVVSALRGSWPRPKRPGRRDDPRRNFSICLGLEALRRVGIHPTRNEATDPMQTQSGCDILAILLEREPASIADIWKSRQKHLDEYPHWKLNLERLLVGD